MWNSAAFGPAADPVDRLRECERLVAESGWMDVLPVGTKWPLTTDTAAKMLREGGEYNVTGGDLDDLIERRLIAPPARGEDGFEWSAEDVITTTIVLEQRQQWKAAPSKHDPKKHPCHLALEEARACGTVGDIVTQPTIPHFDLRHLLTLLTRVDSYEGRVKVAALLEAVLDFDHEIVV